MAALLQRIDEALAGIHGFAHEHFDGGTFETNALAELDEHGKWRTWDMNAPFSTKACAFIAAAPALLRECAALLRGLDDGAVGELRAELQALRDYEQAYSDGWRTRVELGDCDGWASNEELMRWNEAANKNPHAWNTPLYTRWRHGFLHNDVVRRLEQTRRELGECRAARAALEADNVRLREALAATEAELRQYREPM